MAYRSPYLRLDELRQDRFAKNEQTAKDTAKTFPAAALSLRDMLQEEEDRKRQIAQEVFKNNLATRDSDRADEQLGVSKGYLDVNKKSTEQAKLDRDRRFNTEKALRAAGGEGIVAAEQLRNSPAQEFAPASTEAPEESLRNKVIDAAPMLSNPIFGGAPKRDATQEPLKAAAEKAVMQSRIEAEAKRRYAVLAEESPEDAANTTWRDIATVMAEQMNMYDNRARLEAEAASRIAKNNRVPQPREKELARPPVWAQKDYVEVENRLQEVDATLAALNSGAQTGLSQGIKSQIQTVLRMEKGEDQQTFEARRQSLFNQMLYERSGAAVTESEFKRLTQELGRVSDPEQATRIFMNILKEKLQNRYNAVIRTQAELGYKTPKNVMSEKSPEQQKAEQLDGLLMELLK